MASQLSLSTPKQKLMTAIRTELGDNMVDVELTAEDLLYAIQCSLDKYRQRSENGIEEAYAFLKLQEGVQDYYLPEDTVEVREIFRRSIGAIRDIGGDGLEYEPFSLAYTNIYLLQAGGQDGLLTYELYNQYLETAGRLYGAQMNFNWDNFSRRLTVMRNNRSDEEVLLWVYKDKPDDVLIEDRYSKPWIRDYAIAKSKYMLGQAYEKFSQISGPQGGFTLNGASMKTEAQTSMEKLEEDILQYRDGQKGLGFIIG